MRYKLIVSEAHSFPEDLEHWDALGWTLHSWNVTHAGYYHVLLKKAA